MLKFVFLLIVCFQLSQSLIFGDNGPKWNGLKVTWGINPLSGHVFAAMPRTESDAIQQGWIKISSCDLNAKWRGQRYIKDGDYAVVLLFDIQGYIAGIQTSIPNNQPDGYPSANIRPPFVPDGDRLTISAYFVNPAQICSTGRSASQFAASGTGTDLYLQTTDVPENSILIPKLESNVNPSEWTQGKCFVSMGNHYWHQLTVDMDCEKYIPVFLLYNGGELNAFGWAMFTELSSPRYEHPDSPTFKLFMKEPPTCLINKPKVSTMHIYLTHSPLENLC